MSENYGSHGQHTRLMYASDPSAFQTVSRMAFTAPSGMQRGKLPATLTREYSNELGTKFSRRSDTFESSQRMGQAMRVEQIPLKAPEAVPGAQRISETAQRFAPAADFRPRKPAGFVSEVSRGIDTRRCIVGINEPRAPAIPHSEQRAQFAGLPLRERPTVQLTLQYQNELGTKLRLEVADKSEIRRTHYEPACPPAAVPPLITTAQQHHAPPDHTRARLAGQGFAERDAFVRAVSAQPLERAKFRDAPDAQLSPAAKADRATRAAYRPPVAMDIISQRERYYEDRTYDPARYKGFTRNNMYGTEGMLGSQVNIITGLPKRY